MFRQFETILTPVCLALGILFLTLIIIRIRAVFFKNKPRIPVWKKELGVIYQISGPVKAFSLLLMAAGITYFIFIMSLPSAVIRIYAKTLFILIFSAWALLESYMSFSIPEKLPKASVFWRVVYFFTIMVCIVGAMYLFPKIIQSYPFPVKSECVLLDLPVRGTWLSGQAGATTTTNAHFKNRYAIDCLKLGSDVRFYKGDEKEVTDFYSYGEPIYAPADGQITEIVDNLPSDLMGERDKENPGGNYIIMDSGNGKYVYFAHLIKDSIAVEEGQTVETGTILGYIGNSGNSMVPHMHMHVQNKPTSDPEGRITYPFRFKKMQRKRLIFWREVSNGALIRNDWFCDYGNNH
jgi:hypothetical protein